MAEQLKDEEAIEFLKELASGSIELVPAGGQGHTPLPLNAHHVFAAGPWTVIAAYDGGGFDYIDMIISPDYRVWTRSDDAPPLEQGRSDTAAIKQAFNQAR